MELLTIAEIARALEVPDSTVRYYRDRFENHLPSVGSGRSRRYLPEAVDMLRDIMGAVKGGATVEEVRQSIPSAKPEVAAAATALLTPQVTTKVDGKGKATVSSKAKSGKSASGNASGNASGKAASKKSTSEKSAHELATEDSKKSRKPQQTASEKPLEQAVRSEAAVSAVSTKILPVLPENPTEPDLQACRTMIESEIRDLHKEISMMREMISNLVQIQSESQVGERDKQLVEALKGLQSMKSAPKKRWFGWRS